MTGREALKEIFNIIYNLDCGTTFEQDKKLNECRDVLKRVIFNAEKSLKAFEIIKEKRVACDLLTNPDVTDYKKYNSHCDKYDFIVPLTEEEFNLLKEVLE